jgi:hypothetical protein
MEIDLLKEALEPTCVTIQITPAASVRALSLEDTVDLKARAWHDRFVISWSPGLACACLGACGEC